MNKLSIVKCVKVRGRGKAMEEMPVGTDIGQSMPFHFSNANASEPGAKPAIHYSRQQGWFRDW